MKKFRQRSTKNIIKEINEINNLGYRIVSIADDNFLANKKQANELFDEIIKEKLDMKFIITAARVSSADEKLYKKMKKAGVTHIQFGVESGNQDVLDFYNKKIDLEKIKHAINLSNKTGFFTIGSFIVGAPFETKKHFQNTLDFAKTLPFDSVSFLPLKYMAGSQMWYNAVKNGDISENEYLIQTGSERNLGKFKENEIISFCNNANKSYYFRPSFALRLLAKSLRSNDFGFLQSYISLFFSNIKKD